MTVSAPAAPRSIGRARGTPPAWLVIVAFAAALVVFGAAMAEIGLRLAALRASSAADPRCAGSDTSLATQNGLYQLDPIAGYTMRPDVCVRLRTSEYDQVLRTNAGGYVGPLLPPTKPAGEFRIVVLGDSYTVGGQVPYEQTFPAVLEQLLHQRGFSDVRVVNLGVGGYTTYNEAGLLREDLSWLQPDLVVVAAFLGNDVGENVLATAAGYTTDPEHPKGLSFGPVAAGLVQKSVEWFPTNGHPTSSPPAPWNPGEPLPRPAPTPAAPPEHASVGPFPEWVFDPRSPLSTAKNMGHWLWDTSRGSSLLLARLFGQPPNSSISTEPGERPPSAQQRLLNISNFEWTILRQVPHTYWLDIAWPLFGAYLDDVHQSAASVGAQAVVLAIPEIAQVEPAEQAQTMADFRFSPDQVDWQRPQRELAAQAAAAGLSMVDLLPAFRQLPADQPLYFPLDQHFTPLGHQQAAAALATALIASGQVH